MSNAGIGTVEWLFREQLKVDPEWSIRTPKGFRWWADRNAQTIEVIGQETGPSGETGYLVSVRTDLFRSLHLGDREITGINALVMSYASMAGPVYDQETQTLELASLIRVDDHISAWMNPLISLAAVLQVDEARILGAELARALGAKPALSGPPGRALRAEPDELAGVVDAMIAPLGENPSRWSPVELQDCVDRYMNQPPALLSSAGGAGLTVEFPFGKQSSLCEMRADQPHPKYGNGLLLLQSFPLSVETDMEGMRLALAMNRSELIERPFGYGFGSYAYRDKILYFTAFFPNAGYRHGLVPNLYYSCAHRAREMSLRLAGEDWSPESFSAKRTALGRVIDRIEPQDAEWDPDIRINRSQDWTPDEPPSAKGSVRPGASNLQPVDEALDPRSVGSSPLKMDGRKPQSFGFSVASLSAFLKKS